MVTDADLSLDFEIEPLLRTHGRMVSLPAGTHLFEPGAPCTRFLVLHDGTVQVRMISDSGREIVLYRIGRGETCIMTTACLLAQEPYPAEGITETPCRAWVVAQDAFDELLARSPPFRRFVFREHGKRLRAMMTTLDDAVFQRLDIRLAALLCRSASNRLALTHQAIGDELGTAREVISRLLKDMELRGWISLGRGSIAILDREALQKLAGEKKPTAL